MSVAIRRPLSPYSPMIPRTMMMTAPEGPPICTEDGRDEPYFGRHSTGDSEGDSHGEGDDTDDESCHQVSGKRLLRIASEAIDDHGAKVQFVHH